MRGMISDKAWDIAVLAFNASLTLMFLIAFWVFWGRSASHFTQSGGLPPMTVEGLRGLISSDLLLPRTVEWGLAWVYGIFAVGTFILAVSGIRYLVVYGKRFF